MLEDSDETELNYSGLPKLSLKNGDISSSVLSVKHTKLDTSDKLSDVHLGFGVLEDDGERYLKEGMMLPPIGPMSGTKYYVNLHPTDSDFSSSTNSREWRDCLNYDEIEDYSYHSPLSGIIVVNPQKEIYNENTGCFKTKEMKSERKFNFKNVENEQRQKLISELEKQMLSLYNIKKQYKRNLDKETCLKGVAAGPSRHSGNIDQLSRQRDLILQRIKRNTIEQNKRKEKQIERKLSIVKRLLTEQRKGDFNTDLYKMSLKKQESSIGSHLRQKLHDQVHLILASTDENPLNDLIGDVCPEELPEIKEELGKGLNILENEQLKQEKSYKDIVIARDDNSKIPTMKGLKKALKITTVKNSSKKDNKKKKGSKNIEARPAICEGTIEPPTHQMKDLLLWCDNWRETQEEDIRLQRFMEAQTLPVEDRVVLNPMKLIFKDVVTGRVTRRGVEVLNTDTGQGPPLQCRVAAVSASDHTIQAKCELDGPSRARVGQHWTLWVSLEVLEPVELDDTALSVWLEFCREAHPRPTHTRLTVEVEVKTPHARPALDTNCVRFGSLGWWTTAPPLKYVKISNTGSVGCSVQWEEVSPGIEDDPLHIDRSIPSSWHGTGQTADEGPEVLMARALVELAVDRVFRVFSIAGESQRGTELPAHSTARLPVRFRPDMAVCSGDVFTKYKLTFHGERVLDSEQYVLVCGHIEDSPLILEPPVLDLRVCYVGCSVQQGVFRVTSSARHSTTVSAHVPPPLSHWVKVRPREAVLQPQSSSSLAVRVVLSWNFMDVPCSYLDRHSGLLSFPILLTPQGPLSAPPLLLSVVCLVAPPCPLSLTPSLITLGQVTTQETVSAKIHLKNHIALPYNFAFVNLSQSVLVEPGGGVGTILPNECLELRVLYSPGAVDTDVRCGQPGTKAETHITLRCFTDISLASPVQKQNATHNVNYKPDEVGYSVRSISSSYCEETISTDKNSNSNEDTDKRFTENPGLDNKLQDFISEEIGDDELLRTSIHTVVDSESDSERSEEEDLWDKYTSVNLYVDNIASYRDGTEKTNDLAGSEERIDAKVDSTAKFVKFTSDTKVFPEAQEVIQPSEEIPPESQRHASLVLQACLVDPLLELSAQAVLLPPTPCYSYSIAHIYLRCRPLKRCSVHRKISFKTWFEFQSPWEHLQVEPRTGCVYGKQSIKIALIFRPVLLQEQIYRKALETKIEYLTMTKMQEQLEQYYKAKEKKTGKNVSFKGGSSVGKGSIPEQETINTNLTPKGMKGKKKAKGSVISSSKKTKLTNNSKPLKKKDSGPLADVTIDPATVEVTEDDLRIGKTLLLKYLEASTQTVTVRCLLETQRSDSDERRLESMSLRVVCTTVPPPVHPSSTTCLQFGPIAVGVRAKLQAQLTNISFFDIPIVLSTLNPLGYFHCTTALEKPLKIFKDEFTLPPEHVLTVPILFCPKKRGEVMERFEVRSDTCVVQFEARGEGVEASFKFSSDQEVFNMVCAAGKKADATLSIINTCEAPLPFNIHQVFSKKGTALPADNATSPDSNMGSRKAKPLKQKKVNNQKQFNSMSPELMTFIHDKFDDINEHSLIEPLFKIINVNKSFDVRPKETKTFSIRFTPPKPSEKPIKVSLVSKDRKNDSLKENYDETVVGKQQNAHKTAKEKSKTGKDDRNAKQNDKRKSKLVLSTNYIDNVNDDYFIYAAKYEVYIANVKKVKEFLILATVKRK